MFLVQILENKDKEELLTMGQKVDKEENTGNKFNIRTWTIRSTDMENYASSTTLYLFL